MITQTVSHFVMLAAACALLATAACSNKPEKKEPEKGNLARSFDLIDKQDGKHYGTVDMDPLGGGKITDADGRVIGNIVPPPPPGYAPVPPMGYAPPPPPYGAPPAR